MEAAGVGGGGDVEGFIFVVGLAADDHDPDDAGEFMSAGDDAFGFAEPAFEAADVFAHFALGAGRGR